MFDTDFDSDISFSSNVHRNPQMIARGVDVMAVIHPKDSRADARDIKQARHELKRYIQDHQDKPYAFWEVFKAAYGDTITQDGWSGEVFRQGYGQPTTPERLLSDLEDTLKISSKLHKDAYKRKWTCLLEGRKFNPVKRYLEKLPLRDAEPIPEWDTLAAKLFGVDDPLSQEMLSRWLIGAVARAMNPGCRMDTALVIRGEQGIGKTSFLRALFGQHFITLHSHQKDEEQKRMLGTAWGLELGELESITRVKDVEAMKAFLSETNDIYRELYAERPEAHPRHCVFAGTANSTELLRDDTGSRRFWVIDAGGYQIPVDWVEKNRDRIWSTAYLLWMQNKPYWFDTADLRQQSEKRNEEYRTANEFLETLAAVMEALEEQAKNKTKGKESAKDVELAVKGTDLLSYALNIPVAQHKANRADRKVASAMQSLGYERRTVGKAKAYCKPDAVSPELVTGKAIEDALRSASGY